MNKHRIVISLLITAVLLGITRPAQPESPNRQVKIITIEDGLSQGVVHDILQDRKGFMWFATGDGLNRFDGYSFKIHYPNRPGSGGANQNIIRRLHESSDGDLWIGTSGGLIRYTPAADHFIYYLHNPRDPRSLSSNTVESIQETPDGKLWVGTIRGGLNRLERETGEFVHYSADHGLHGRHITELYLDRAQTLWVGSSEGLYRFDPAKNRFRHHPLPPPPPGGRHFPFISGIYEDKDGTLWIGTADNAVYRFDRAGAHFTGQPLQVGDPGKYPRRPGFVSFHEDGAGVFWVGVSRGGLFTLDRTTGAFTPFRNVPFTNIRSLYESRGGVLWAGSLDGVVKLSPTAGAFSLFRLPPGDIPGAPVNVFSAVLEDRFGFLWFSVENRGLVRLDRNTGKTTDFSSGSPTPGRVTGHIVTAIHEDAAGVLWVAAPYGRLYRFRRETGAFVPHPVPPELLAPHAHNSIGAIVEDNNRNFWMPVFGSGLIRFSPRENTFNVYRHIPGNPNSPGSDLAIYAYRDHTGDIWLATYGSGVDKFTPKTHTFKPYRYRPADPHSISADYVLAICEDASGHLWFGTSGNGFNKFDRETEKFTRYSRKDGLPNDTVYSLQVDGDGFIWCSTNRGLSKFDPGTETFENYDVHDGLQSNEFNSASTFKSRRGELFFGGVNGLTSFFPGKMEKNPSIPPVVITDFKLFNTAVAISPDSPLKKASPFADSIRLSYDENFFSFRFAAMDFTNPGKNRYAYRLEGYDRDWVTANASNRWANYTGVPPGEYIFRVKGSNNDGVWNEEGTSVRVIITPPFWRTLWFRALVVLFILAVGYKAYNIRLRYLSLKIRGEMKMNALFDKHHISEREKEIVQLLLKGKNNKEIEELLFISPHTVKNHIYNIFKKCNVNTRSQLITLFGAAG